MLTGIAYPQFACTQISFASANSDPNPQALTLHSLLTVHVSNLTSHQGRATMKRGLKSSGGVLAFDPRANFLAFAPPTPGDSERQVCIHKEPGL